MPSTSNLFPLARHSLHVPKQPITQRCSLSQSITNTTTSPSSVTTANAWLQEDDTATRHYQKYSYRKCPICSERVLVRIHGAFVHKWVNRHFATHHHEWMHVVVNMPQR